MSAVPPKSGDGAEPVERKPTRTFRKFNAVAKLSPEQMRRQNNVLQSAWRHFGVPGPVIAFLNAKNDGLQGGQPLHIALESEEGLQRVERLLGEMTYKA